MFTTEAPIAVLGAGLAGCCVALELARRGHPVCLVDRDPRPLNRASLRNEGKIHLGLIYANDPSFETARLQLRGALRFRRLLERWVGPAVNRLQPSAPFDYLVAKDSLLSAEELSRHYARVDALYREELDADPTLDYLGNRPPSLVPAQQTEESVTFFRSDRLQAVFRTAELALDPAELCGAVRAAVTACRQIRFRRGATVRGAERHGDHYLVEGDSDDGAWRIRSCQVVNTTWESRLFLDSTVGIEPTPGWVHRLKYRVIARLPERLRAAPSATMVLGRYGDAVVRGDGTVYLSWYPSAMRGWSHDLRPPEEWSAPCRGETFPEAKRLIGAEVLERIGDWFPGMEEAAPLEIDAGAILAFGRTDVDDRSSGLHDRSRIGVRSFGGWHSVDPGKLTTAPLFAAEAAEQVDRQRRDR